MTKYIIAALAAGLLIGAAAARHFYPRTETVEKEVVRTDVKTVTVVVRPDGTREEVTTVDRSTRVEDKKTVELPVPPKWLVTGGIGLSSGGTAYTAGVQKRLMGPLFIGAQIITSPGNNSGLVTATLEF